MAPGLTAVTVDDLRAYVSMPGPGTTAGVLVIPAIYGLEGRIETYCAWLNELGIASLVWDPFAAYGPDLPKDERMRIALEWTEDTDALREQLVWLAYMRSQLKLRAVAVLGFCTGGRMALTLCATDSDVAACVAYHPSVVAPRRPTHVDAIAAAAQVRCPVLVFYPGGDHVTSIETFRTLRDALEARPAPTVCAVFPDADHGFSEIADPSAGGVLRDNPSNSEAMALADPATEALLRSCLLRPSGRAGRH
jgi:carboxymethylenebutenolidase